MMQSLSHAAFAFDAIVPNDARFASLGDHVLCQFRRTAEE